MVVYLRLRTEEELADELEAQRFRILWEENEAPGLPSPWRSLPIKVWALLHEGPLTASEIAAKLQATPSAVRAAIRTLREHGQDIFCPHTRYNHRQERKYHLVPRQPLRVVEGPAGLRLAPRDGKVGPRRVIIELK